MADKLIQFFESEFIFLHRNSIINLALPSIFYLQYIQIAMSIVYQQNKVEELDSVTFALNTIFAYPMQLQGNNILVQPNFALQIIQIVVLFLIFIILWLVKNYAQRPPSILTQILINTMEVSCTLYFFVFLIPLYFCMIQQMYDFFLFNNQENLGVNIVLTIISICLIGTEQMFWVIFCSSYQEYKFAHAYTFNILRYYGPQSIFVLFMIIFSFIFQSIPIVLQVLIFLYSFGLIIYMAVTRQFCLIQESTWIYGVVQFCQISIMMNALFNIICTSLQLVVTQWWVKLMLVLIIILISTGMTVLQYQQFQPVVENSVKFRQNCNCFKKKKDVQTNDQKEENKTNPKEDHQQNVELQYGVSKDFALNMLAYHGPEFCGVLNPELNQDLLLNSQYVELTKEECDLQTQRIYHAETMMEKIKLLYENIYSNIFYSYNLCGQTLEHLTLLDIEEALPFNVLLKYVQCWKTPADSAASVLHFLNQLKNIDEMLQVDSSQYTPVKCYDFVHSQHKKQEHNISLFDILRENCLDVQSIITKINRVNDVEQKLKKDNLSLNPERALWHNNYQIPSDQQVHGMLCLLNYQDYMENQYLFKHFSSQINKDSVIYVYVPSFTSKSVVTGNIHRISFCNDQSAMKTASLRRIRFFALISLSRVIFPFQKLLGGKFRYPLVQQYSFIFQASKQTKSQINKNITVFYNQHFDFFTSDYKNRVTHKDSLNLYVFAPYLLNSVKFDRVDATMLQYILVEYFITKMCSTCQLSPRTIKFFEVYNNDSITAFQKIQLCVSENKLDQQKLQKIKTENRQNMDDQVVFNAISIVFGCGAVDKPRTANCQDVFQQLMINQFYYTNNKYTAIFINYVEYLSVKFSLYQLNFDIDDNQFQQMKKYVDEFKQYLNILIQTIKTYSKQHQQTQQLISQFLHKYQQSIYQFVNLKVKHNFEEDQLQLLQHIQYKQYNSQQNTVIFTHHNQNQIGDDEHMNYQEYSYKSVQQLHQQLNINMQLQQLINQYNLTKISNLNSIFEDQFREMYYPDERQYLLNPYKTGMYVSNSLHALQIVNQFLACNENHLEGKRELDQSSMSSSYSHSDSDQYEDDEDMQSSQKYNTVIFDINLRNPKSLDDYISIINNNYFNLNSDNAIFLNHEASQNTPEFLINVIKGDYIERHENFNITLYSIMLSVLTDLHFVKLNDKTIRNTNTVCYIIPRIQAHQERIEKMILTFLKNLITAKQDESSSNNLLLLQAMNSISVIEQQIKKLHQARSMILKREHLNEDHVYQLRSELNRALKVTYGFPMIQLQKNASLKEKLQVICETYAGAQQKFINIILEQIETMPRCGGVYSEQPNYVFKRHRTWFLKFKWEESKKCKNVINYTDLEFISYQKQDEALGVINNNNVVEYDEVQPYSNQIVVATPQTHGIDDEDDKQEIQNTNKYQKKQSIKNCCKNFWNIKKKQKNQNQRKRDYTNCTLVPLIIMSLVAICGFSLGILIIKQQRLFFQVISQIEQGVSENLYRLDNLVSSLYLTSQKSNFDQAQSNEYKTVKYTQFAKINDKMFENYLYLETILQGKYSSAIYEQEKSNNKFMFNLTQIMASDLSDTIQCESIIPVQDNLTNAWYNMNANNITASSYQNSQFKNIGLFILMNKNFRQQYISFSIFNQSHKMNLVEILHYYVKLISCYSQSSLQILHSTPDTQTYKNIIDKIIQLELVYQQQFLPMFEIQLSNQAQYVEKMQNIIMFVLITIILILAYIFYKYIAINMQSKIIIADLDKGSIISQIAKLPITKLETIISQYKLNTKSSKRTTQNTTVNEQLSVKDVEKQQITYRIKQYLMLINQIFLRHNFNTLFISIILGVIFFVLQYQQKGQYFQFPYKMAHTNLENIYSQINTVPQSFIPENLDVLIFDDNLPQNESNQFQQFKNQNTKSNHPVYSALKFTQNWNTYFTENDVSPQNVQTYISVPFSQIVFIKNYLLLITDSLDMDIQERLIRMTDQVYQKTCKILQTKEKLVSDESFLNNLFYKVNSIYIDQCNDPLQHKDVFTDSQILEQFNTSVFDQRIDKSIVYAIVLYIFYYITILFPTVYIIYHLFKYIINPFRFNFGDNNMEIRMFRDITLGTANWIFLILVIILLVVFTGWEFYNFAMNMVFLFNRELSPSMFEHLTNSSIFIYQLVCLITAYGMYDSFCISALTILSSLGVTDKGNFIMPYDLKTRKNLLLSQIFKASVTIYTVLLIIFSIFYFRSHSYNSNGYLFTRMVSNMNQEAISMQQANALRQNYLFMYQQYFSSQADLVLLNFQQEAQKKKQLQQLVNLAQYGNTSQQLIIHRLADDRWNYKNNDSLNIATLKYTDANPPSFIYGVNNYSEFQKLRPPRDNKIGPHLLNKDDNMSFVTVASVLTSHRSHCVLSTGSKQIGLEDVYKTLSPLNDVGISMKSASDVQKLVISHQKMMNTDLLLRNEIINAVAYEYMNKDIEMLSNNELIIFIVFVIITIVFFIALIIFYINLRKKINNILLKSNLFTSLFLKKILGIIKF